MFTGIIRGMGEIEETVEIRQGIRLSVRVGELEDTVSPGDSIAVDGVCLTAETANDGQSEFLLSAETLERSALGRLGRGDRVNLEPAVKASEALGGHILQGHVDAVGTLTEKREVGDSWAFEFQVPETVARYCVEKGSIGVNGVSLTIAELQSGQLTIAIIPYTYNHTNLGLLEPGDRVNLEADVISKYVALHVENLLSRPSD